MALRASADALLRGAVENGDVPGVVALATTASGTIYEGGFGVRALGAGAAMTADTVVWIASMTKALTATAAMQLVERGKLDLDGADGEVLQDLVTRHLRQLAAEGTLPIWGRRRGYWALWELAPPAFWKHHQVDFQSFLEADPKLLHALPCNGASPAAAIGELMTCKAAVDAFCESVAL